MPRGRPTHAAGLAPTGIAPIPAPKNSSHFGTLTPKISPCNLEKLDFTQFASNRHARISNRHLVRLEITATPTKSTSSLFLIDPKHQHFTGTRLHSPETLVAQACPACVRFPPPSHRTPSISTVYSMQLEIGATPAPSTNLRSLLGTPTRTCRRLFLNRTSAFASLAAIRAVRPAAKLAPNGHAKLLQHTEPVFAVEAALGVAADQRAGDARGPRHLLHHLRRRAAHARLRLHLPARALQPRRPLPVPRQDSNRSAHRDRRCGPALPGSAGPLAVS